MGVRLCPEQAEIMVNGAEAACAERSGRRPRGEPTCQRVLPMLMMALWLSSVWVRGATS